MAVLAVSDVVAEMDRAFAASGFAPIGDNEPDCDYALSRDYKGAGEIYFTVNIRVEEIEKFNNRELLAEWCDVLAARMERGETELH